MGTRAEPGPAGVFPASLGTNIRGIWTNPPERFRYRKIPIRSADFTGAEARPLPGAGDRAITDLKT